MEVSSSRKYYRPIVKKVTREWVRDNCKYITERDMGLIRLIKDRRILRRDQVERLYPEFASTDRLNKRLKLLYQKHIIDKIYPATGLGQGSSQQHICLDKAGQILLDLENYTKPIYYTEQGARSMRQGWEHRVMLNEYECRIKEVVGELGGTVTIYEVEKKHNYHDTKIIPDIFCFIKYNGKGYPLFVEVDLATETVQQLKDKTDSYREYFLSKSWLKQPWTKVFKSPSFPRVLLFTEEGLTKRKDSVTKYTDEWSLRFIIGSHSEFKDKLMVILKS